MSESIQTTDPVRKHESPHAPQASLLPWSDLVGVMLRPRRTYQRLGGTLEDASTAPWRRLLRGPLLWLVMLGAFVSLTSAGRLVWYHMLLPAVFWSFLPIYWSLAIALTSRGAPQGQAVSRRVELYFKGFLPWYIWMFSWTALVLFTPWARVAASSLLPILGGVSVLAILWSFVLVLACYKHAFGFSTKAAWLRTIAFHLLWMSAVIGYYIAADQLLPLFNIPATVGGS